MTKLGEEDMATVERSPILRAADDDAGMSALSVRGVSAGYGATAVLRDVSIDVLSGKVSALVGPNGAGKTTLLKVISGLLPATDGQVLLYGADVTRRQQYRRSLAGLCHVREGRAIYRALSVRDNLRMQARPGDEKGAIERGVNAFPILGKRLNQVAGTLSGGEQQMLAMASVSARDVRLILFDEPSMGLSPVMVDQVYDFMKSLGAKGMSLLVVDQYVHRVLALADHAYVLRRGQVVFSGEAGSLMSDEVFAHFLGDVG